MKKSIAWMLNYAEATLKDGKAIDVLLNGQSYSIHSISGEVVKGLITITLADGGVMAFDAGASWGILRRD
ncbi:hypothetical protein HHL26_04560 [Sphingobium sp. TB-6]|uniref:hypothetical protein n=1 Tax=Sphingobium sp. TB-6 TaxID=2728850 RepID=UPI00146D36FD|nr:hypothetical protein [Sphingobium sp. TB-6]NML88337.1 hypothetical protein [Sphingobium sp. TB-6]